MVQTNGGRYQDSNQPVAERRLWTTIPSGLPVNASVIIHWHAGVVSVDIFVVPLNWGGMIDRDRLQWFSWNWNTRAGACPKTDEQCCNNRLLVAEVFDANVVPILYTYTKAHRVVLQPKSTQTTVHAPFA